MVNNKISSGSKGFAHILILLVVIAVLGVGGAAYWRISSYNKNDSKDSTQSGNKDSAALSSECVAQTKDENICHLGAISDLSSYSSEVHMTTGSGDEKNSAVMKFDGKGNYFIDAGGGIQGMSVNGKYYIYMEKWYDTGSDPSQVPKSSVPSFGFATTAGITYTNLGKEACGKDTCFKYKLSGGMLGDGIVTTTFEIGRAHV